MFTCVLAGVVWIAGTIIQRSVYEGSITESRLERLKAELLRRLDCAEDSVRVYKLQSLRYVELDQLGVASPVDSVVI